MTRTKETAARRACMELLERKSLLANYHLTFKDEFTTFESSKWQTSDFWGMRNNPGDYQAQWFSDPASAPNGFTPYNPFIATGTGSIKIQARPTPSGNYSNSLPYVSGQLTSAHKFTQRYGYYELRAKLPAGKGLWSRFWLLNDDGNWPGQGEYDIFEVLGKEGGRIYQTTHFKNASGNNAAQGSSYTGINPTDGNFHTYGFLWEPTSVTWYVDGVATLTQVNRVNIPAYALIDLVVGNDPGNLWPGSPDGATTWPSSMELDYFRVYSADPSLPSVTPDPAASYPTTLPGNNTVVSTPTTAQLPAGWSAGDLGSPSVRGSSTWNSISGEWMLKGAGLGISGFGDQGQFASTPMVGNGSITATVQTATRINSNDVKAGVMIRDSTATGAREIALFCTTSSSSSAITFQSRSSTGGNTTTLATIPNVSAPVTLRLARSGNMFVASYSTDGGTNWTTVGTPQTIAMSGTALAGLGLCGNSNNYFRLSRATFNNVVVIGDQTLSRVVVSPANAFVGTSTTRQFTATAYDQSGIAMAVQPAFTWTKLSGVGSISSTGLYTAPGTVGAATITATSSTITGNSATISVVIPTPAIATTASATPNPVTTNSTTLSVLGSNFDGNESALTYTWSLVGSPPAGVSYSSNGTNASKNVTVTFSTSGNYEFIVTVANGSGLTASSSVNLAVVRTPATVAVSSLASGALNGRTVQFSASVLDQFGIGVLGTLGPIVWSVQSGGGTITNNGLYTAPALVGTGSVTVRASVGTVSGTAPLTITLPSPWTATDINTTPAGNAGSVYGNWTVFGGGTGVAINSSVPDNVDSFRFVHRALSGDGTATVLLTARDGAQSGMMIRDASGASDRYAAVWRTDIGLRWATRETTAGGAVLRAPTVTGPGATLPVWIRLVRAGSVITAFYSTNGTSWTSIGSRTFAMNATTRVGLVVASGNTTATSTASFSNFSVNNAAPTIGVVATATPDAVTGKSTSLSVLGADDDGEANLRYTWTTISAPAGAPAITFTPNDSYSARQSTASFGAAGAYTLRATLTDDAGTTVSSDVSIVVEQTLTRLELSPTSTNVSQGASIPIVASAFDQFDAAMTPPADLTWSLQSGSIGTISAAGLYTAPTGGTGGSATVVATSNSITATASIVILPAAPALVSQFVNGGAAQRNSVTSVTYVFSSPVTVGADAFNLTRQDGGSAITVTFSNPSGDGKTFVLVFSGADVVNGSLPEGRFSLAANASLITDAFAQAVTGNLPPLAIHRLLGDINGDAAVGFDDLLIVAQNYGMASGATGDQGDLNEDGAVDFDDLLILAQNYARMLVVQRPPTEGLAARRSKRGLI